MDYFHHHCSGDLSNLLFCGVEATRTVLWVKREGTEREVGIKKLLSILPIDLLGFITLGVL